MKKLPKLEYAQIGDLWTWDLNGDIYMIVDKDAKEVIINPLHMPDKTVNMRLAEFYVRFKKVG